MNKQIVALYEFDKDLQDSLTGTARTSFGLAAKFSAKANDEDTVQDHAKAIEALQHSLEMALEQKNSAVEFYNTAIERHQAALEHISKQVKSTTADPDEDEEEIEEETEDKTKAKPKNVEDIQAGIDAMKSLLKNIETKEAAGKEFISTLYETQDEQKEGANNIPEEKSAAERLGDLEKRDVLNPEFLKALEAKIKARDEKNKPETFEDKPFTVQPREQDIILRALEAKGFKRDNMEFTKIGTKHAVRFIKMGRSAILKIANVVKNAKLKKLLQKRFEEIKKTETEIEKEKITKEAAGKKFVLSLVEANPNSYTHPTKKKKTSPLQKKLVEAGSLSFAAFGAASSAEMIKLHSKASKAHKRIAKHFLAKGNTKAADKHLEIVARHDLVNDNVSKKIEAVKAIVEGNEEKKKKLAAESPSLTDFITNLYATEGV